MHTKTDGVTLGLGEQAEPAPGNTVPVFGVSNIATARSALEEAGVRFDGPTETIRGNGPARPRFMIRHGNALMLAQDLTGPDLVTPDFTALSSHPEQKKTRQFGGSFRFH